MIRRPRVSMAQWVEPSLKTTNIEIVVKLSGTTSAQKKKKRLQRAPFLRDKE